MIHIVSNITATNMTGNLYRLPLIPASAQLSIIQDSDDQGRVHKYELTFRLQEQYDRRFLKRSLILYLDLENGEEIILGTRYVPIELDIQESGTISASCTWQRSM